MARLAFHKVISSAVRSRHLIFLLAILLVGTPVPVRSAYADEAPAFVTCFVNWVFGRKEEPAKKGEGRSPEVKDLENKEKEALKLRQKIHLFMKNNGSKVSLFVLGSVFAGVMTSYEDEAGDWYTKLVKEPVRELAKRWFLVHRIGGRATLDGMLDNFKKENEATDHQDWKSMSRPQQQVQIEKQEANFKKFLDPFRQYSPVEQQDLLAKKDFLTMLSSQLLSEESVYVQARASLQGPHLTAEDKNAIESVIKNSQKQLDDAVSLWEVYVLASPSNEVEQMDPGLAEKFESAKGFVMDNTDLTLYHEALLARSRESIKVIEEIGH